MSTRDFSVRHAATLTGHFVYSRVTLSCGHIGRVANPQRPITTHDPWHCSKCDKPVRIVAIEPTTLAEQDALCQPASEPESEVA